MQKICTRVKCFSGGYIEELEAKINKWLDENPNYTIISIGHACRISTYSAIIVYKYTI